MRPEQQHLQEKMKDERQAAEEYLLDNLPDKDSPKE